MSQKVFDSFLQKHPTFKDGTPERQFGDFVFNRDHSHLVAEGLEGYDEALEQTARTVYQKIGRPDLDPDHTSRIVAEMRRKRHQV